MQECAKRALILSGGGLFGAWQVGAWGVLRQHMPFDVIIGASIGALNGWAIAGGATPEELGDLWSQVASQGKLRLRVPRRPLDGVVDPEQIQGFIRTLYDSYQPKQEYYAVITDLLRLKPRLIRGPDVHWHHLAASCALLGVLPQPRIDRVLYTDGGFLGALPLWAATHCHATQVVGLNVMPRMPWVVRACLRPLRAVRGKPERLDATRTLVLQPSRPLGNWKQGLMWERAEIRRWMDLGRKDAETALAAQPKQLVGI